MSARSHRRTVRLATIGAAGLVVLGTVAGGSAGATRARPELPPLDPQLLRQAIAGLPSDTATGASIRISGRAGQWSDTAGVADIHTERPVPANGRFRIGSVSKAFTAVVVLQLAAEHRIELDRPVQAYLPDLLPDAYPNVTVRQLLNHTSGLPDTTVGESASDPAWYVAHRFDTYTPEQVVASAFGQPMAFQPGTQQQYAGINYFVAGLLVEQVTGHDLAYELRRRVLRPLGLRHTSLPSASDYWIRGPHAHGYVEVDGRLYDVTEQSPYSWAEGGMISTTADLTRFTTALFRGRLLPPRYLDEMFTLPDVDYTDDDGNCAIGPNAGHACYSAGLTVTTFPNGVTVWGKSGSVAGYTSGVFATRDLRRVLVYSLQPTGNRDGSDGTYVQNIAGASFDPSLVAGR